MRQNYKRARFAHDVFCRFGRDFRERPARAADKNHIISVDPQFRAPENPALREFRLQGIAILVTKGYPINDLGSRFGYIGGAMIGPVPFIVILFFLVMIVCWLLLRYLRIGRIAYAIGGNEYTTFLAGIPVKRYKILFYVICGFFAGMAGLVLASRISSAIPNMGTGFEMNSIGAAVIGGIPLTGGRGNVWGTLTGVLLLGIIGNGLNLLHVDASFQYVVTGLIIIIAVIIHEQRLKKR